MGCASCSQGERPTEAVDGGATEMDLQYGDNEESDAVAISICVVDESDHPGADSAQVWRRLCFNMTWILLIVDRTYNFNFISGT